MMKEHYSSSLVIGVVYLMASAQVSLSLAPVCGACSAATNACMELASKMRTPQLLDQEIAFTECMREALGAREDMEDKRGAAGLASQLTTRLQCLSNMVYSPTCNECIQRSKASQDSIQGMMKQCLAQVKGPVESSKQH